MSAASGAVGQVVGQLAKIHGCRAVGIAGGPRKCAYVVDELGFDACIDYKAGDLPTALAAAVPDGIDVYFENVGGEVLEAVIPLLNPGCRVPVAGWVSQYNLARNNAPWEQQQATPLQRLREAGLKDLGEASSTEGFRFFHFFELADLIRRRLTSLERGVTLNLLKGLRHPTQGGQPCLSQGLMLTQRIQ